MKKKIRQLDSCALILSPHDNVAVAKKPIPDGILLAKGDASIRILQAIPAGHRFALSDIPNGRHLKQYGNIFGISKGIRKGERIEKERVGVYSVSMEKEMNRLPIKPLDYNAVTKSSEMFMGYPRSDGAVGTRNYYVIIPTSLCAGDVASRIAASIEMNTKVMSTYKNIDGIIPTVHTEGCGCNTGEIIDRLLLTLKNTILNPNVCAALIVDLGCEKTNYREVSRFFGNIRSFKKPVDFITIQAEGGTGGAIEKGKSIVRKRLAKANAITRKPFSISHLFFGTECGASDTFSGITANALIGSVVDTVIDNGGSAILSETPEMIGAETALIKRMASRLVAKKFIRGIRYYKNLAKSLHTSLDGNFVPGNEKGGLVNVALKSLGAIVKGGSRLIVDFVDYAERSMKKQGLIIMNGPGNDLESMTGIAASGANIILFSTGMGATEGNAILPVIRVASRTELYETMKGDMDFNAGVMLDKEIPLEVLRRSFLNLIIAVASGKKTKAELWKKRSFQIWTAGKLSL